MEAQLVLRFCDLLGQGSPGTSLLPIGGGNKSSELEWPKRPGIAKTLKSGGRSSGNLWLKT
jgi:hypothetical protein